MVGRCSLHYLTYLGLLHLVLCQKFTPYCKNCLHPNYLHVFSLIGPCVPWNENKHKPNWKGHKKMCYLSKYFSCKVFVHQFFKKIFKKIFFSQNTKKFGHPGVMKTSAWRRQRRPSTRLHTDVFYWSTSTTDVFYLSTSTIPIMKWFYWSSSTILTFSWSTLNKQWHHWKGMAWC